MASIELKRCPFCGGYARYVTMGTVNQGHEVGIKFVIRCERCRVRMPSTGEYVSKIEMKETGELILALDERAEAANDWNRRDGDNE